MSAAPPDDTTDSLRPPAFASEPSAGAGTAQAAPRPFGTPLPWTRIPASRRTGVGWIVVFALLLAPPLVDSDGGHLDNFANAGTFVVLALGLNIVVGFAGLLDLG